MPKSLYNGGLAAFFEGRYGDAVMLFTQVHRLRPKNVCSLYYRGLAYNRLGAAGEAEADWKAAGQLERSLNADPRTASIALTPESKVLSGSVLRRSGPDTACPKQAGRCDSAR